MKKFIFLFLLVFMLPVYSQSKKTEVECFNLQDLAQTLVEFGEKPFAVGTTPRIDANGLKETTMIFFINPKTLSWTLVEKMDENSYCVMSAGYNFNLVIESNIEI